MECPTLLMTDNAARLYHEWDALVSMLQAPAPVSAPAPAEDEPKMQMQRQMQVPVTVVGGFLGAGKTTLLRHLLTSEHGLRLSVVVNDLGEVNIDAQLLASVAAERIDLSNGCSCCTLGPDLARSLLDLAGRLPTPDAIIIESSGVGDPTGIATVIAAQPRLRLDGIITVVDATSLAARLDEPALAPLLQRQLDAAHLVTLSRSDQLGATELTSLIERLATLAPGRPVIPVEHGRLDPAIAISAASRGARPEPAPAGASASGFTTSTLELPTPIPRDELIARLESLNVLRAKGFVALADAPGRSHLVQMVGRSWTVDDWGPPKHDQHVGRMVTISLK